MITKKKLVELQKKADKSIRTRKYLGKMSSTYYDEREKILYITDGYFAFCLYNVEDENLLGVLQPDKKGIPIIEDTLKKYTGLKTDVSKINLDFETTNIGDYWYNTKLIKLIISVMGKNAEYSYADESYRGIFAAESEESKMIVLSLRKGCSSLEVTYEDK